MVSQTQPGTSAALEPRMVELVVEDTQEAKANQCHFEVMCNMFMPRVLGDFGSLFPFGHFDNGTGISEGSGDLPSPRSAVAVTRTCPRLAFRTAQEMLDRCGSAQHPDRLGTLQIACAAERARALLFLPKLSKEEMYLSVSAHDLSGHNALDIGELVSFLNELFAEVASAEAPEKEEIPCCDSVNLMPRSSPTDELLPVLFQTMDGESFPTTVYNGSTTLDLTLSFNRLTSLSSSERCQFVVGGSILQNCMPISKQGVVANTLISVIRVAPPPRRVQLVCDGLSCGPSIRGSCGTFCLTNKTKNGRPTYARDRVLSQWNLSMKYHGDGGRYLIYEDHPTKGGRWALTDDQNWGSYEDRSYAFIVMDVPNPSFLEGHCWHIFKDTKHQAKEWVKHTSFKLVVEEEQ